MVKNNKLDALILLSGDVLIRKNVDFYKSVDTSSTVKPKSLDRRVHRNIKRESRKNEFGDFYILARRFVAAILVVCAFSFAVVLAVEPLREAVWSAIVEFFEDYISIDFSSEAQFPTEQVQLPATEAQPPTVIEEIREIKPGNTDWQKQVVLSSMSMYYVTYSDNETIILSFSQNLIDATENWIDNENSFVKYVKVGEYLATLIFRVNQQAYTLCWSDGEYSYILDTYSPETSEEELISIAQTLE